MDQDLGQIYQRLIQVREGVLLAKELRELSDEEKAALEKVSEIDLDLDDIISAAWAAVAAYGIRFILSNLDILVHGASSNEA